MLSLSKRAVDYDRSLRGRLSAIASDALCLQVSYLEARTEANRTPGRIPGV